VKDLHAMVREHFRTWTHDVGVSRSRHLVVWFRVAKKLEGTNFIRDSKCKRFVVAREDISTPSVPYLR
jgi:hypothetical protein